MKFLLDENIGKKIAQFLQKLGYSVTSIREIHPGIDDYTVLELANTETKILITSDKDFGELVFKENQSYSGIIFLRLDDQTSENKIVALREVFSKNKVIKGKYITVTEKSGVSKIRVR